MNVSPRRSKNAPAFAHRFGAEKARIARGWGGGIIRRAEGVRSVILVRLASIRSDPIAEGIHVMLSTKTFDELAAKIGQAIQNSPAKDIEKNVKTMLSSGLAKLDLVPRAEFDVQAHVLLRTREKLEGLEKRLAELEARFPPPSAAK
jgi:BMFP domain-containing protein YqiC